MHKGQYRPCFGHHAVHLLVQTLAAFSSQPAVQHPRHRSTVHAHLGGYLAYALSRDGPADHLEVLVGEMLELSRVALYVWYTSHDSLTPVLPLTHWLQMASI